MEDYIRTVVEAMKKYEDSSSFRARLVISVNRGSPYAAAESSINAAIALRSSLSPYIVRTPI